MKIKEMFTAKGSSFLDKPIEKLCSSDELRPAFQSVYFKDGYIYATDAHLAIKQSLSLHGLDGASKLLDGKMLHKDSIKAMKKCRYFTILDDGVIAHYQRSETKHYFVVDGIYPDINQVIPSSSDYQLCKIGVNPSLLSRLQSCLFGSDHSVVLEFSGVQKAIVATTGLHSKSEQISILMPTRID